MRGYCLNLMVVHILELLSVMLCSLLTKHQTWRMLAGTGQRRSLFAPQYCTVTHRVWRRWIQMITSDSGLQSVIFSLWTADLLGSVAWTHLAKLALRAVLCSLYEFTDVACVASMATGKQLARLGQETAGLFAQEVRCCCQVINHPFVGAERVSYPPLQDPPVLISSLLFARV